MYVMSSLPSSQQSVAGGVFNTLGKMCVTVGPGIGGGVYTATSVGDAALQEVVTPYRMVFLFATAAAGLSILFVPFLTIGKQGCLSMEEIVQQQRNVVRLRIDETEVTDAMTRILRLFP
jgi:hypothetical protein